jgi:hypothetical protein
MDNGECIPLQTDLKGIDKDVFDEGKSLTNGIALTMSGVKEECKDDSEGLRLTVNLRCDATAGAVTKFVGRAASDHPECNVIINYTSP